MEALFTKDEGILLTAHRWALLSKQRTPRMAQMNAQVDILLVEDDEADIKAALRAFSRHPKVGQVVSKTSGEEALSWLRSHAPQQIPIRLVVLDLGLPGLSGLEVLREMKNDFTLVHLPVVVLSNQADPTAMLSAYRQGACAFLTKPSSSEGYLNVLDGVVQFWLMASWPSERSSI